VIENVKCERKLVAGVERVKMLNDEKEIHIKRAVFLPMYYTVISLMIPLSLWAAWGIYSQPIRYRSLFPHNEARKQAIAVCLLTVLFFLPFFQIWINTKVLLLLGSLYAFLIVPITVGFVKPDLLQQQTFIIRIRRKLQFFKNQAIENLKQFVRTFCLFLICVKEFFITLPYFYRSFITFQVITNQIVFFILSERVICPQESFISLALLVLFTVLMYVRKRLKLAAQQILAQTESRILLQFTSSVIAMATLKLICLSALLSVFLYQFNMSESPVLYVCLTTLYFVFTEPHLEGEDTLTDIVAYFQSDIFEQLEHLYIPLFVRLLCILSSLCVCLLAAPQLPVLVSLAVYTNIYVPFTRLSSEVLSPLEQEIRGMQAFRAPTQEELRKAGSTCPVCLEEMHVSRITPCGHVFHAHCLRQCLTRSTSCPYCRAKIL